MASEGYGFGKVILFGEHFVVYPGTPAIACGLNNRTIVTIEDSERFEVVDNRPETPGYKEKKKEQFDESVKLVLKFMGINPEEKPIRIKFSGNLVAASGVGASAAMCAALARALSEHFNLGFDNKKINEAAHEGEKAYHGSPSGIDDTCATYGGMIWFIRGEPNRVEQLKMERPVEIVEGNSGLSSDTKQVVEDVRKWKEKNPEEFNSVLEEYKKIVNNARAAIEAGDVKKIGELMDRNQELLRKIGVSCDELEQLIKIAKDNGAWGAKLTGTGRGGLMVALTPGKELQEKVAKAMEDAGFMVLKTSVG